MKNIAVLSILVIILSVCSYAEESEGTSAERNFYFSLGPQLGFVYGQTMEYVYPLPGETKNELLSELVWDMKPVFYYGIQAKFSRIDMTSGPGFFFSVSFKTGIQADSGVIEDRDWMWPANSELTNFSSHTNRTDKFLWLDAAVGASFPIKSLLYIKPFIGGSWMRFAFTGRDGYGIYKDSSHKEQELNFSGVVASYQQDWLFMSAGFSVGTNILSHFLFDISFQTSPLTYCSATDNHIERNTIFRDITQWGLLLEPSFNMSFVVNPIEFSFGLNYRHIGKTKGESYGNEGNTGFYVSPNKAGAGLSVFDSRFIISIRL